MNDFKENFKRIENLQSVLNVGDSEINLLKNFQSEKSVEIEIEGEKYPAWRIIHNNALGPGKGGIRFHPKVDEEEVRSLSFWMSLKNSLAGLPFGGAKGGISFDPRDKTKEQLDEISRRYVRAFYEFLGEDKDVPAPDVYTNPSIMGVMLDEFEKIKGEKEPAMITGKPLSLGGCILREDATGVGAYLFLEEMIRSKKMQKEDIKISIQGFGNAGFFMAKKLDEAGFKIVAISDSKGGKLNMDGLNIKEAIRVKKEEGLLSTLQNSESINEKDFLSLDVDVLVLAALGGSVNEENAKLVKAKNIIEVANGPITPSAEKVLLENRVFIVPDIISSSGGVIGSFLEWVQNKNGNMFSIEYLKKRFNDNIKETWQKTFSLYKENEKIEDMRTSAYILAIKRIFEAERARGRIK